MSFSKASRVLNHQISSQVAWNSLLSLVYPRHNENLFVFDRESRPHFTAAAVGLDQTVPKKIRGLMCFICQADHQSAGPTTAFGKGNVIHNSGWTLFMSKWLYKTVLLVKQRSCGKDCNDTAALTFFINSRSLCNKKPTVNEFGAREPMYCGTSLPRVHFAFHAGAHRFLDASAYPEAPLRNSPNGIGLGKVL